MCIDYRLKSDLTTKKKKSKKNLASASTSGSRTVKRDHMKGREYLVVKQIIRILLCVLLIDH